MAKNKVGPVAVYMSKELLNGMLCCLDYLIAVDEQQGEWEKHAQRIKDIMRALKRLAFTSARPQQNSVRSWTVLLIGKSINAMGIPSETRVCPIIIT